MSATVVTGSYLLLLFKFIRKRFFSATLSSFCFLVHWILALASVVTESGHFW